MIVRMSKVEIVGAKDLLQDTLGLLRDLGIFQIEPAAIGFVEDGREEDIRSFIPDEKTMLERLFLENLRQKITELFSFLPRHPVRESYLQPRSIIDTIAKTIERHISFARVLFERQDVLAKERTELERYAIFLGALAPLVETTKETPDLDFIGLTIREPGMVDHLREAISRITDWKFELMTQTAGDGSLVGLLTVEKDRSDKVKKSLSDEHVPELILPAVFKEMTFSGKVVYVKKRIAEISREISGIEAELSRLARRWIPIYKSVLAWLDERLALLSTSTATFETRLCFFINGWMATSDLERAKTSIARAYGDKVLVAEKEMREEDLERVPIILKNPPYFEPFEIFTSILPLPSYTSYDPTPFIGIFFPIFFGMILGDAGYGLLLGITAFLLARKFRKQGMVRNGAKILMAGSLYSIFFGVLFGEFFGDLPERLFHLRPLLFERREAVIPMMYFALSIGVAHILLGLLLGAISGFQHGERKEATYKVLSIVIILGMIAVLATFFGIFPALITRPIIIGILLLTPVLFFTGGILAPLELLKSIGNIISYIRIMAIGLTSVLLAFVANQLGGETGDIITGLIVAGLLHLLNIILGVFSPTIHSLRLHYVEFFSKFLEHGGRRFEPLRK